MKIYMVPHDPNWRQLFQQEAEQLTATLGSNVAAVHHIGSTAIPTIYAKPVLDILLVVRDRAALDEKQPRMEGLGYVALGEFGIAGRRYFRRDDLLGERTHQVHAFENDFPQIKRHLAFRDYMIDRPETAQEYSDLKRELAAKHLEDIELYMDGKDEFIKKIDMGTAQQDKEEARR